VQSNGKFRCVPSVDNFKAFRKRKKHIVNNSGYGAKVKTEKLAPIVRGGITTATAKWMGHDFTVPSTTEHSR